MSGMSAGTEGTPRGHFGDIPGSVPASCSPMEFFPMEFFPLEASPDSSSRFFPLRLLRLGFLRAPCDTRRGHGDIAATSRRHRDNVPSLGTALRTRIRCSSSAALRLALGSCGNSGMPEPLQWPALSPLSRLSPLSHLSRRWPLPRRPQDDPAADPLQQLLHGPGADVAGPGVTCGVAPRCHLPPCAGDRAGVGLSPPRGATLSPTPKPAAMGGTHLVTFGDIPGVTNSPQHPWMALSWGSPVPVTFGDTPDVPTPWHSPCSRFFVAFLCLSAARGLQGGTGGDTR